MVYTKAGTQCDKVGRTKLTTLATIDEPWRIFKVQGFWTKFQPEVPLFGPEYSSFFIAQCEIRLMTPLCQKPVRAVQLF